jgi:Sec-independent protein translocase protein TatA
MKKNILFIILGVVIIIALVVIFSKPKARRITTTSRSSRRTTGQITPKTKEELAAEKRKARKEERLRKRELRKRQREERKAQRLARRYSYRYGYGYSSRSRTRRSTRRSYIGATRSRRGSATLYQLRAIFTVDNIKYALIDNRQVKKGDEIMGKQIVDILTNRIIVNESGKNKEVKIGESAFPNLITQTRRTTR